MSSDQRRCPRCGFIGPHGSYDEWHEAGDANCQTIAALREENEARSEDQLLLHRLLDEQRAENARLREALRRAPSRCLDAAYDHGEDGGIYPCQLLDGHDGPHSYALAGTTALPSPVEPKGSTGTRPEEGTSA